MAEKVDELNKRVSNSDSLLVRKKDSQQQWTINSILILLIMIALSI